VYMCWERAGKGACQCTWPTVIACSSAVGLVSIGGLCSMRRVYETMTATLGENDRM